MGWGQDEGDGLGGQDEGDGLGSGCGFPSVPGLRALDTGDGASKWSVLEASRCQRNEARWSPCKNPFGISVAWQWNENA